MGAVSHGDLVVLISVVSWGKEWVLDLLSSLSLPVFQTFAGMGALVSFWPDKPLEARIKTYS